MMMVMMMMAITHMNPEIIRTQADGNWQMREDDE